MHSLWTYIFVQAQTLEDLLHSSVKEKATSKGCFKNTRSVLSDPTLMQSGRDLVYIHKEDIAVLSYPKMEG